MKHTSLYLLVILLIAGIGMPSCKKDRDSQPPGQLRLSKITVARNNIITGHYTYEYDVLGRITKQFFYEPTSPAAQMEWRLSYNGAGKLTEYTRLHIASPDNNTRIVISYNGDNKISNLKAIKLNDPSDYSDNRFTYTASGYTIEHQGAGDPEAISKQEYLFDNVSRNAKEIKFYEKTGSSWHLSIHISLDSYDNKKSPGLLFPEWFIDRPQLVDLLTAIRSENNLLEATEVLSGSIENFSYSYNSNGYPVEAVFDVNKHVYEYIIQ